MEEKKTNELNDEKLDEVTGGNGFVRPNTVRWCSHCNDWVYFQTEKEGLTYVKRCLNCGNQL